MPRKFGSSLRWRIIRLNITHRVSPSDICDILSLGKTFVHKVLRIYRETGGVEDARARETRGRPRNRNPMRQDNSRDLFTFTSTYNINF